MKDINWILIGFIKRSKNRQKAMELLDNPLMPSELGKKMSISLTHASKIIRELTTNGLIRCLNEELKTGRMYQLTNLGKKILMEVERIREKVL